MIAPEERGLLAKLGLFMCREGQLPEAEAVFGGLRATAPAKDGPVAGLALCRIIRGECDEAVGMIDERLASGAALEGPLTLYKLVALGMGGRLSEARALRARMESGGMARSLATADALLDELAILKAAAGR